MNEKNTDPTKQMQPSNTVREAHTIAIDTDHFKPDAKRVQREKLYAMAETGLAGTVVGAMLPKAISIINKNSLPKKLDVINSVVTAAVLGSIGLWVGLIKKTPEEDRSETLLHAAKSGKFEEAIKSDMAKRESEAYTRGRASAG